MQNSKFLDTYFGKGYDMQKTKNNLKMCLISYILFNKVVKKRTF